MWLNTFTYCIPKVYDLLYKALFLNVVTVGDESLNSTEFRELIELFTAVTMRQYDERALDNVNKALTFQYSPWPHIENRILNLGRASQVCIKTEWQLTIFLFKRHCIPLLLEIRLQLVGI